MGTHMTSKNISITKDVYDLLSKMKLEGESFSEAIRRLAARRSLEENAGLWAHLPDEEMEAFGKSLRDLRDRARESLKVG
jgi:predicted CopG family antitoxin